jgi:hypothetical protein
MAAWSSVCWRFRHRASSIASRFDAAAPAVEIAPVTYFQVDK